MKRFLALLALVALTVPLKAQPNCSKGKPCGNTCIARDKVCRVGTGTVSRPTATQPSTSNSAALLSTSAIDPARPFFAFRSGLIFYRNAERCEPATIPAGAERVYYPTSERARQAGLRPSTETGCDPTNFVAPADATGTRDSMLPWVSAIGNDVYYINKPECRTLFGVHPSWLLFWPTEGGVQASPRSRGSAPGC